MVTNLKTFNNKHYQPGSALKRVLWYLTNVMFFRSAFPISSFKCFLLRLYGAEVGSGVVIKPHVNIKYPWFLRISNHVWIGEHVWIDNLDRVTILDNCCISQGALLLCGNHDYKKSTFDLITGPITLESGVWIGAKTVVCPGVTCRSHSVLTVGSVASKDLDAFTIYRGNPAQPVKTRTIVA
jgi:putative colanic acid biosynthesis acetyltransferase WcaF